MHCYLNVIVVYLCLCCTVLRPLIKLPYSVHVCVLCIQAAAQDTRSVHTGADSSLYDPSMSLEQRRNLKDAQDGIMSLRAMGDALLGSGENESAGKGGASVGGSRIMSGKKSSALRCMVCFTLSLRCAE